MKLTLENFGKMLLYVIIMTIILIGISGLGIVGPWVLCATKSWWWLCLAVPSTIASWFGITVTSVTLYDEFDQ